MNYFNTDIGSVVGGVIGIAGDLFGGDEKKRAAKKAGRAQRAGINKGLGELDKSLALQQPFVDLGTEAGDFFNKYQTDPKFRAEQYTNLGKANDPLYDFYQSRQDKSLNRRLAKLGRLDSGAALESSALQNSALSANFADITDRRVQSEINNQFKLLGTGQRASEVSSDIYGQRADLQLGIGQSNANQASAVGAANAGMFNNASALGFGVAEAGLQGAFGGVNEEGGVGGIQPGGQPDGIGVRGPQVLPDSFKPEIVTGTDVNKQVQQFGGGGGGNTPVNLNGGGGDLLQPVYQNPNIYNKFQNQQVSPYQTPAS